MRKKGKIILFVVILTVALIGWAGYRFLNSETGRQYFAELMKKEFIPNQIFDINQKLVIQQRDSIYQDFRNRCSFHFQTIGLAEFSDSSYLFVISEPAHYVQMDSVLRCFSKFNIQYEIRTHPIGHDGWVKDILISVGSATPVNIENITRNLNPYLYLSDYKPFTVSLPLDTSRIYFSSEKLNYRISLSEINQWFIDDKEPFTDLIDSIPFSIPDIFEHRKTGVFYSQLPGFVIWCLDKKEDIYVQQNNIRRFAVDADLILGAISDSATLAIIGREREADMMEVPPLNVETILLLASIKEGELSQSLDVNDLLAGKMSNDKDWCPTFLSPQLEHTEFGNLLTITDVLLKDWSENGTLRYEELDYPKPSCYPFDRPLFGKLGLNELVYNWNTANTMFVYDYNNMSLYALNRTGSLPVSYFNSQAGYISAGHRYENRAYNYFSDLCNTDLIRVVQYTSLYQIFQDNHIQNKQDSLNYAAKNKPYLLFSHVKKLLTNIRNLSDAQIDSISKQIGVKNYDKYQHTSLVKQMDDWERDHQMPLPGNRREQLVEEVRSNHQQGVRNTLSDLRQCIKNMDEKSFNDLCSYLSYPRGNRLSRATIQKIYPTARKVITGIFSFGKPHLRALGMDLSSVKEFYSNTLLASASPWIKTPSLIISYNSPKLTGGHNLSAGVRRVNSMNADKAIVNSGRPQEVPKTNNAAPKPASSAPSKPTNTTPKPSGGSAASPAVTAKPSGNTPVRSRNEVIPASNRTERGFATGR